MVESPDRGAFQSLKTKMKAEKPTNKAWQSITRESMDVHVHGF